MKTYGGSGSIDPRFLDLGTSLWGECSALHPGLFTPGERASVNQWIGGWVGPRASLDMENWKSLFPPGLELRPLGRSAHSQCYPAISQFTSLQKHFDKMYFICIRLFTRQIKNNQWWTVWNNNRLARMGKHCQKHQNWCYFYIYSDRFHSLKQLLLWLYNTTRRLKHRSSRY
jgi:hypothetical protein